MKDIIITNSEKLEEIKENIKKEGKNKIHIISDFDRTLTKAFVNGEKVPSIISIIRKNAYLGEDYAKKAYELFDKYHPIEKDPKISHEKKKEKMHEWWETHYKLLKEKGMSKEILRKVVEKNEIEFREGVGEFLDLLHEKNIPLVVLSSSGIGNCIEMFFDKIGKKYKNIHIISNFLEFGGDGKMIGIKGKIIHPYNKNEASLKHLPIYNELKERNNVVLLGDSLGDLGMVEGFDYKNIIKIGFFNYSVDSNFEDYKKKFDILLLNDCDMNYVNKTMKEITQQKV